MEMSSSSSSEDFLSPSMLRKRNQNLPLGSIIEDPGLFWVTLHTLNDERKPAKRQAKEYQKYEDDDPGLVES